MTSWIHSTKKNPKSDFIWVRYGCLLGTSHHVHWSSKQRIPTMWLVESEILSAQPLHKRLTTKKQRPPKCLRGSTFCEFWHHVFFQWRKVCTQYLQKTKLSLSVQTFLSKLIQTLWFVYFNKLLPLPLQRCLSRVL
jgi:hypothetical protein